MSKRVVWKTLFVLFCILLFGGSFSWNSLVKPYFMKQYFATFTPPPVVISTTKATQDMWQPSLSTVGNLMAVNGVKVSSQTPGIIKEIKFQSGQRVKKEDALVQIDDSVDQASLKGFQAQALLAKSSYARMNKLYEQKAASKQQIDQLKEELDHANADVLQTVEQIKQKAIVAPFSGKLGIRMVNLGEYISPGTALVSLQAMDPLHINFNLPEQNINSIYVGQNIEFTVGAFPGKKLKGIVNAINSEVSTNTHNIKMQATVPNKDNKLYPGMYAQIDVLLPKQQEVIAVPQTAINYSLYGDSIYVVTSKVNDKKETEKVATRRFVILGDQRGDLVAIQKGIKVGDDVVTSGQLKLRDGATVTVDNTVVLNKTEPSQ